MIINILKCFTFAGKMFLFAAASTAAPREGSRRAKAPWQQQTEQTFRVVNESIEPKVHESLAGKSAKSSSISPTEARHTGSESYENVFIAFAFPTDKNKKQKSDILNFLVVCFTICFFFIFLSYSLTLRFRCFSIFFFFLLLLQQISRSFEFGSIFFS